MNIHLKVFATGILMIVVLIFALYSENYFDVKTAFIYYGIGSLVLIFFYKKIVKYDNEVLKEKEEHEKG